MEKVFTEIPLQNSVFWFSYWNILATKNASHGMWITIYGTVQAPAGPETICYTLPYSYICIIKLNLMYAFDAFWVYILAFLLFQGYTLESFCANERKFISSWSLCTLLKLMTLRKFLPNERLLQASTFLLSNFSTCPYAVGKFPAYKQIAHT